MRSEAASYRSPLDPINRTWLNLDNLGCAGPAFPGFRQVAVDAVLRGEQAGEEGGPAGGADRVGAVGAGEAHPFLGQAVEVGGLDLPVPITPEGPGAVVIREDHHNVGPAL